MVFHNIDRGRDGEDIAADFFRAMGYTVRARNYRNRFGEVDIILEKGGLVVFVEVKTRTSCRYGLPQEAVTRSKQRRIRRMAMSYIQHCGLDDREIRFDVIGIVLDSGRASIEHIPDAF